MMSLRWAVLTKSGKNLRIYAPNVLAAAKMLKPHGEEIAFACEAGCWHPHARRPVLVTDEDGAERWTVVFEYAVGRLGAIGDRRLARRAEREAVVTRAAQINFPATTEHRRRPDGLARHLGVSRADVLREAIDQLWNSPPQDGAATTAGYGTRPMKKAVD